jgi:hypothetical protein
MVKEAAEYTTHLSMTVPVGLVVRLGIVAEKEHAHVKTVARTAIQKYVEDMEKLHRIIPQD